MLEKTPINEEMICLIGQPLFEVWTALCELIESKYEMERLWNHGGKKWTYEYKYRRGGKTLCALYAKENVFGFMIIFGKEERGKFEAARNDYSIVVQKIYDDATTYHDGKWVMFELTDTLSVSGSGKAAANQNESRIEFKGIDHLSSSVQELLKNR